MKENDPKARQSAEVRRTPSRRRRRSKKRRTGWITAALILAVVLVFLLTPPGAKAVGYVHQKLQEIFAPQVLDVPLEGETEPVLHVPEVQEPATGTDTEGGVPGFVIYYDEETYVCEKTEDATFIRFVMKPLTDEEIREYHADRLAGLTGEAEAAEMKQIRAEDEEFIRSFPKCWVEIRHLADQEPAAAAEAQRNDMVQEWSSMTEIEACSEPEGVEFSVWNGSSWDSSVEDWFFVSDGGSGCFTITSHYFMEATEGHGVRFRSMIKTFEVVN